MNSTTFEPFPINIPLMAHVKAKNFCRHHTQAGKAQQVYLNTLGVNIGSSYLNFLGWATSLKQGDSWNPICQTMMDVADLYIPSYGKLECRVVLPDCDRVRIPPEVWSGRIGYIIIQLNRALTKGTVLGFIRRVDRPWIFLNDLDSLEDFPSYLKQQKGTLPIKAVNLSNWQEDIVEGDWQPVRELFAAAPAFRSSNKFSTLSNPSGMERVKLMHISEGKHTLALIIDVRSQDERQYDISVMICSYHQGNYLPEGLEMIVADDRERPVMLAQANQTETIEFCFSGEQGENFSLEVALDEEFKVEKFVI